MFCRCGDCFFAKRKSNPVLLDDAVRCLVLPRGVTGISVTSHIPITSLLEIYAMENTTSAARNVAPLPRLPGSQTRWAE